MMETSFLFFMNLLKRFVLSEAQSKDIFANRFDYGARCSYVGARERRTFAHLCRTTGAGSEKSHFENFQKFDSLPQ